MRARCTRKKKNKNKRKKELHKRMILHFVVERPECSIAFCLVVIKQVFFCYVTHVSVAIFLRSFVCAHFYAFGLCKFSQILTQTRSEEAMTEVAKKKYASSKPTLMEIEFKMVVGGQMLFSCFLYLFVCMTNS